MLASDPGFGDYVMGSGSRIVIHRGFVGRSVKYPAGYVYGWSYDGIRENLHTLSERRAVGCPPDRYAYRHGFLSRTSAVESALQLRVDEPDKATAQHWARLDLARKTGRIKYRVYVKRTAAYETAQKFIDAVQGNDLAEVSRILGLFPVPR